MNWAELGLFNALAPFIRCHCHVNPTMFQAVADFLIFGGTAATTWARIYPIASNPFITPPTISRIICLDPIYLVDLRASVCGIVSKMTNCTVGSVVGGDELQASPLASYSRSCSFIAIEKKCRETFISCSCLLSTKIFPFMKSPVIKLINNSVRRLKML